jgi:hypothetical protein
MKYDNLFVKFALATFIVLAVAMLPFQFNPLINIYTVSLYWYGGYLSIGTSLCLIVYFILKEKKQKLKIIWSILLLILFIGVWFWLKFENKWWNMVDIAPYEKWDQSISSQFYWTTYLIGFLPVILCLIYAFGIFKPKQSIT